MKVNELRIGNLVSITYEAKKDVTDTCHLDYLSELARDHFVISHFSTDEINVFIGKEIIEFSLSEIEPIPLTAEWLEKLGFERHATNKFWFRKKHLCVSLVGAVELISWDMQIFKVDSKTEHVHQLQNLFFALTGEELTIKEEPK